MGQANSQQQQQVVPGVRIDVSNIRSTTRFNDLQEDIQNKIAEIDKAIQGFMAQKAELDAFMPAHGDQVASIPTDVSFVSRKAAGVETALGGDAVAVKQLRELVKVDADNARLSFKAVDNLKLPTAYHQAGLWSTRGQQGGAGGAGAAGGSGDADGESSSDLVSFFSKTADEMGDTMRKFEKNLTEIEMHLRGVQGNVLEQLQKVASAPKNGVQNGADEKVVELAAVLRDFEESILQVAGVVGGAREGMTSLQLGEVLGRSSNGMR
jgi:nucleoporin p58/p45